MKHTDNVLPRHEHTRDYYVKPTEIIDPSLGLTVSFRRKVRSVLLYYYYYVLSFVQRPTVFTTPLVIVSLP